MMFLLDDTIAALASAARPGGRGIIRCSGPQVREVVAGRFTPDHPGEWHLLRGPRRHTGHWQLGQLEQPVRVELWDWPTTRSYTGQPQVELHTVGSPPLLEAILADLYAAGARPAQPGEFTLRAFLAGRIDLMQAEAVLGVIDAADERELKTALQQLAGGISQRLDHWRTELLDLLADLEAGLDFTEEGLEFVSREFVAQRIDAIHADLLRLVAGLQARQRQRLLPRVVLSGRSNAGKSTLFNALIGRPAALVSPEAGTTRDYLTAEFDWSGIRGELIDTAGWEASPDQILDVALTLRAEQLRQADVIVHCVAADDAEPPSPISGEALTATAVHGISVITKVDLTATGGPPTAQGLAKEPRPLEVSAVTGQGLDLLREEIARALARVPSGETDMLGSSIARCHDSLQQAIGALSRAGELARQGGGDEFLATDVREALEELGRVTGAIYTDDLLDRIFSKFCIGK